MAENPVEGLDYTIEKGLLVFTKAYLARRGTCCGSGCRNCPYPGNLKVVSMVPSWTETLLACGANVVGRTRFCIHPQTEIPAVGGTKNWNLEQIASLGPDLVVFDEEENPRGLADAAPCPWLASRIRSVRDVSPALREISQHLAPDAGVAARLRVLAERWDRVLGKSHRKKAWVDLPGVIEWLTPPEVLGAIDSRPVVYVIWREPWMAVAPETFIGSVLELLGLRLHRRSESSSLYPEFSMADIPPDAVFLYSSEPYPFQTRREELIASGRPCALVNGESYSWFGLRALEFLEKS